MTNKYTGAQVPEEKSRAIKEQLRCVHNFEWQDTSLIRGHLNGSHWLL